MPETMRSWINELMSQRCDFFRFSGSFANVTGIQEESFQIPTDDKGLIE